MESQRIPKLVPADRGSVQLQSSFPVCGRARSHCGSSHPDGSVRTVNLTVPELSLVVLIGPSGSGKSTFARKHFLPCEVLSSDYCRYLVSDDENDQAATKE